MGYYLQRAGCDFMIVDGAPVIGESWSSRWDSLVLFTSTQFDDLAIANVDEVARLRLLRAIRDAERAPRETARTPV